MEVGRWNESSAALCAVVTVAVDELVLKYNERECQQNQPMDGYVMRCLKSYPGRFFISKRAVPRSHHL